MNNNAEMYTDPNLLTQPDSTHEFSDDHDTTWPNPTQTRNSYAVVHYLFQNIKMSITALNARQNIYVNTRAVNKFKDRPISILSYFNIITAYVYVQSTGCGKKSNPLWYF